MIPSLRFLPGVGLDLFLKENSSVISPSFSQTQFLELHLNSLEWKNYGKQIVYRVK
jgi:hypothetical protein